MTKKIATRFWLVMTLVLLLLAACTPKTVPAPVPQAAPAAPSAQQAAPSAATSRAVWEEQLEKVLQGAKREGKVVLYMTGGSAVRVTTVTGFTAKYGIPVEAITGAGGQLSEKLLTERRAGLYFVDVYQGGATTLLTNLKPNGVLDPLESAFILPELTDPAVIEKTWYGGKLLWVDTEHKILGTLAFPGGWVVINTNLVKPDDMTSYKDLLDPKWKGKILMFDPTVTGSGNRAFNIIGSQILTWDYWRDFAKQEPVFLRDHRQMAEWVARGKYALAFAPYPDVVQEFINAGMPLMHRTPKEGWMLTGGSGDLALVNRAPHPNAARLLINWILSKEGATLLSKTFGVQSGRFDVPIDFLSPEKTRDPQAKYFWSEKEEFLTTDQQANKMAKEIFAAYLK